MFAKSKRFNAKTVGCGADAAYNPKDLSKPIGGVIPKVDRFNDIVKSESVKSDTESVHSDKSSTVFRTPKAVRRGVVNTPSKKHTEKFGYSRSISTDSFTKDILNAKNVEIRNKTETISEYEQQIKELKELVEHLSNVISSYKVQIDENTSQTVITKNECNELKENLALVKSHHSLALEANESIRHEYKMETEALKCKHEEDILYVENRYKNEVETLKRQNTILGSIKLEYENKVASMEEDFTAQIKHIEEDSAEKIKICDIQFEQRLQEMMLYNESILKQEQQKLLIDFQKFQEVAENEIMKSEIQIESIKKDLQNSNEDVKELSSKIIALEGTIGSKENQLEELHSKLQFTENNLNKNKVQYINEIEQIITEKDMISKEKNQFALTLETTRKTVEVLGMRLRHSDEGVENFKMEVEKLNSSKSVTEAELDKVKNDFHLFKLEHNQLLLSIINSKTALDESHNTILENNTQFKETLTAMEIEFVNDIEKVKSELEMDISMFKQQALKQLKELEKKLENERNKYIHMKSTCDVAFKTIEDCQNILFNAECQLENKEQEFNELATENDRLQGTLAALDQEKGELQVLINEFRYLMEEKDRKLNEFSKQLCASRDEKLFVEERLAKMSHFLEATEFIIKEKDKEIFKLNNIITSNNDQTNELSHHKEVNCSLELQNTQLSSRCTELETKYSNLEMGFNNLQKSKDNVATELKNMICSLENKVSELEVHSATCDEELLRVQCKNLEKDLGEMTLKYTNLLGHQNNMQKIKHVADLKSQNSILKDENEKLSFTVQKQVSLIEKLKKDMLDSSRTKSPLPSRKQVMSTPLGKENITSPMGKSPKYLSSPKPSEKPLTPLRDLNR